MPKGPIIWLLQDGEQLPIDTDARLMRTGRLAEYLVEEGFSVTWWSSRFHHNLKTQRQHPDSVCKVKENFKICLLDAPPYQSNMSLARIRHYRLCAAEFLRRAPSHELPDLILASYPSPELSEAGKDFSRKHNIPFLVDIRDPWPDIFAGYFPWYLRGLLFPLLYHYRRKLRAIMSSADGVLAVSHAMLNWGLSYSGRDRSYADSVFYIGYDSPQESKEILVPNSFSEDSPLSCVFVSTCGRSYDGLSIAKAARILEQRGETRIRISIIGDGDLLESWKLEAEGLKIIRFTGWLGSEELKPELARAHVGLILMQGGLSSFWLGNKFGEYLSSFLLLVNNVPGESASIIEKKGIGENTEPRNPSQLADVLQKLCEDPKAVREMMSRSKELFFQEFDRSEINRNYVLHLRSFLK